VRAPRAERLQARALILADTTTPPLADGWGRRHGILRGVDDPLFIGVPRAAELLGLSEHMVRQAYRSGLLPHRKIGRLVRFTATDLDAYVERTRVTEQLGGMRRTEAARRRRR